MYHGANGLVSGPPLIFRFFDFVNGNPEPAEPAPRLSQLGKILKRPQLGYLIGVFFLATFCFTCFESTFAVLFAGTKERPGNFQFVEEVDLPKGEDVRWEVNDGDEVRKGDLLAVSRSGQSLTASTAGRLDRLEDNSAQINTTKTKAYWLMAFCGFIGAIVQGGCIGPLVKYLGEKKLVVIGISCVGLSLAFIPYCTHDIGLAYLMIMLALFAISSSLYRAPTFGLISLNASADEQGQVMGVTQSVGSLARIIGPLFALGLMDIRIDLPYLICAVIAILAAIPAAKFIVMPDMNIPKGQGDDP